MPETSSVGDEEGLRITIDVKHLRVASNGPSGSVTLIVTGQPDDPDAVSRLAEMQSLPGTIEGISTELQHSGSFSGLIQGLSPDQVKLLRLLDTLEIPMTLRECRKVAVLSALLRTSSKSAAAEALNISRPTLDREIRKLFGRSNVVPLPKTGS